MKPGLLTARSSRIRKQSPVRVAKPGAEARRFQAPVEMLERRQLLSAAITGVVIPDSTVITPPPAVHHHHAAKPKATITPIKLYRDMNANGVLDKGDKAAGTRKVKGQGTFLFKNIKHGNYLLVGQVGTQSKVYTVNVVADTVYGPYTFGGSSTTSTPTGGTTPGSSQTTDTSSNTSSLPGQGSTSSISTSTNTSTSGNSNTSSSTSTGSQTGSSGSTTANPLSSISYVINGTTTVTTLTNNVHEGDTVTADFTVAAGQTVQLSLVSYHAPGPVFDPNTADQQVVSQAVTNTFSAGPHSLSVVVPDCYFQVDFVYGTAIQKLGPAGSNNFYSAQGRLISSAFGGDHSCNCGCDDHTPDPATLSGRIFCDTNLNGTYDAGIDEALAGQTVTLVGADSNGNAVNLTVVTGADGIYTFNTVEGAYTLTEPEPAGHVDAKNFALLPGANGVASQTGGVDSVANITLAANQNATGYDFAEVSLGSLSGTVWADGNNNGIIDAGEAAIANVALALAGTDDLGHAVSVSTTTDAQGHYSFANLRPGVYSITETQPAGYAQGKVIAGSLSGTVAQDSITAISLPGCDNSGINYNFGELPPTASITGRVFCDDDLSGIFTSGDSGLGGVTVTLTGTDITGQHINLTATTASDGTYTFTQLFAGSYTLVESQPAGHLDGKNFAAIGTAGGARSQASAAGPDTVANIALTNGQAAIGYDFAEVSPGSLSGTVWVDLNNNGSQDMGEAGLPGVTIKLTGTNDLGGAVSLTTTTDSAGHYLFNDLRPGTYQLAETQPAGYLQGKDVLGSLGGNAGTQDLFCSIPLPGCDGAGVNYSFGEQPKPTCGLWRGATATIGFWHNKNGQALLLSLNGGSNAMQLGNWLAATFPNLYASFAGKSNAYIANYFIVNDFNVTGQKLNAQVLAAAFAVYVTNSSLVGNVAASYGFAVSAYGTAIATINVGSNGAAFGVANNTTITVIEALSAANARAVNGTLYNGNITLQNQANSIFDAINQGGDIS